MINQLFYGVCINFRGLFMGLRLGGDLPHRISRNQVGFNTKPLVQKFEKGSAPNSVDSGSSSSASGKALKKVF